MAIDYVNPDGLPKVEIYRQVSVATGSKTVFIAGQVARTADGTPVGEGDVVAQVRQVCRNLVTALESVGATFDDVAKLTIYVVDWSPERFTQLLDGLDQATAELGITALPPITGIGVAALAEPDLLVEIEAIAVLD